MCTAYCTLTGYYSTGHHTELPPPTKQPPSQQLDTTPAFQAADIAVNGVVAERAMDHRPPPGACRLKGYQTTLNGWTEVMLSLLKR